MQEIGHISLDLNDGNNPMHRKQIIEIWKDTLEKHAIDAQLDFMLKKAVELNIFQQHKNHYYSFAHQMFQDYYYAAYKIYQENDEWS